jgi:hypothetical protein
LGENKRHARVKNLNLDQQEDQVFKNKCAINKQPMKKRNLNEKSSFSQNPKKSSNIDHSSTNSKIFDWIFASGDFC